MSRNKATKQRTFVTVNVESHESWDPQGLLGNLGRWDKRSGGLADSEDTATRQAGVGEVQLGGVQTAEPVTVSRGYDLDRDAPLVAALRKARGAGEASASQDLLDRHNNPTGEIDTWKGVLKSVDVVEADSSSTDDGEIVLVINCDSDVVRS